MIASGVLILLFVTYQLWGTGLRTNAAQDRLTQEFAQQEAARATASTLPGGDEGGPTTTTSAPGTGPAVTVTPATAIGTTGAAAPVDSSVPAPVPGKPIGQIKIPKIGADFEMVEGVDLNYLADGPGHFPGTPLPGQAGNAALAGHRTTWLAPFNRIDELAPGDQVQIHTLQGDFTYQVIPAPGAAADQAYFIVSPNQSEILDQVPGQNTLTLMACHPKYSAAQRIVVVAKLVDAPAPSTPKSVDNTEGGKAVSQEALFGGSGGDLVGGHPESQSAAIWWSVLAGAIWLAAYLIARRWRSWKQWERWAVYVVALPFFLVPLFFAFENINRLLPAGY